MERDNLTLVAIWPVLHFPNIYHILEKSKIRSLLKIRSPLTRVHGHVTVGIVMSQLFKTCQVDLDHSLKVGFNVHDQGQRSI